MLRHLLGKDTFLRFLKSPETSLSIAARSPQSTKTPVMYAVEGGHLECFEALLDVGADLSATGGTLLHLAALHNHPAMLQRLLSLPQLACKLNDRDSSGVAPLGAAVQGGSVECLQMLQKAGADIRTAVSPVTHACFQLTSTVIFFLSPLSGRWKSPVSGRRAWACRHAGASTEPASLR
eukprot:m.881567 g.881567  ORF g.881567 m.881567 type:complete len:179 (+) comp59862_c0_seq10:4249-4785(+)